VAKIWCGIPFAKILGLPLPIFLVGDLVAQKISYRSNTDLIGDIAKDVVANKIKYYSSKKPWTNSRKNAQLHSCDGMMYQMLEYTPSIRKYKMF
jgi:hypothetical protein